MSGRICGFSADISIIFDPEAPGFVDPLLGVVDADSWTSGYAPGRYVLKFFQPDSITQKIRAIELTIDAHGDAELAWAISEIVVRMRMPARSHDLDTLNRLERAHQDRMRNVRHAADNVELVIHAVNEIDVRHAAASVHRLGSFRAPSAVSM